MGLGCNGKCNGETGLRYGGWFVVEYEPGRKDRLQVELDRAGVEWFLPMVSVRERVPTRTRRRGCAARIGGYMRWIVRDVAMFPGYLFVRISERAALSPLLDIRYLSSILSGAGDIPVEVPTAIMDAINARHDARRETVGKKSPFAPGAAVKVTDGPLQGFEGVFEADAGDDAVTILFDIMGAIRGISIATENVANK